MKTKLVLAAVVLASILSATAAEAQTTLYACYVKNSGTVYRIKTPGTPTKCTGNATEFSWNMEGQVGPQGPEGPQGPAGPSSWPGVSRLGVVQVAPIGTTDLVTYCQSGQILLSGGHYAQNPPAGLEIIASWPHYNANEPPETRSGWKVRVRNNSDTEYQVRVDVYCRQAS
jgi:hypothetical protein